MRLNNQSIPSLFAAAALVCSVALSGCARPRMVDSEVRSFTGGVPAAVGMTYRFERLPSQREGEELRDRIESQATQALQRAGLVHNDSNARYSVQVVVTTVQGVRNPYARERFGNTSLLIGSGGLSFGFGPMFNADASWYSHTVRILIRDIASTVLVYETSAVFDGPWSDTLNLLPAMLEAALSDYPNANPGPRKVVVELPSPSNAQ
jgi:hypothetical protein